jgi:hypothetical protein
MRLLFVGIALVCVVSLGCETGPANCCDSRGGPLEVQYLRGEMETLEKRVDELQLENKRLKSHLAAKAPETVPAKVFKGIGSSDFVVITLTDGRMVSGVWVSSTRKNVTIVSNKVVVVLPRLSISSVLKP